MAYQQFWVSSKTKVDNLWERKWTSMVCFSTLEFQNALQHHNVQLVHPEVVDKYKAVIELMQQYFQFTCEELSKEQKDKFYNNCTNNCETIFKYPDHVAFYFTWKDSSFYTRNKLRLFFLTILRIGQESPWVLQHWDVKSGFEGLCEWSAKCNRESRYRQDLEAPFAENNSGHLLAWSGGVSRYPSIETCIIQLVIDAYTSIHTCTENLLKGNKI